MFGFNKNKKTTTPKVLEFRAPLTGSIVPLEEVADAAFSTKAMGDGVAVDPSEGKVFAPFDCKVVHVMEKSKHAIMLEHESGIQILIHVGMNTVSLKGSGFTAHVATGDTVKEGQTLLEFDIPFIQQAGYSVITPVIVPNDQDGVKSMKVSASNQTAIFTITY